MIRRKDIRVGDTVLLERAGDVIPAVVHDFVVVGEAPGQKLDTARRLGIETVDERWFRRLVGTAAG